MLESHLPSSPGWLLFLSPLRQARQDRVYHSFFFSLSCAASYILFSATSPKKIKKINEKAHKFCSAFLSLVPIIIAQLVADLRGEPARFGRVARVCCKSFGISRRRRCARVHATNNTACPGAIKEGLLSIMEFYSCVTVRR